MSVFQSFRLPTSDFIFLSSDMELRVLDCGFRKRVTPRNLNFKPRTLNLEPSKIFFLALVDEPAIVTKLYFPYCISTDS